jgi:A/G-specific adenine glycosylase
MQTRAHSLSDGSMAVTRDKTFAERLIAWQKESGRHSLPWQETREPYRIWLSEVMLQQTQVATVLPYYERFLARFPDVFALASANVDDVMAHWAGLGYYSRARNLYRSAQQVVGDLGGKFPSTAADLMQLPGVGRSTATAIAAFAYGERGAILEGNVKRVLCRVFGIERPMDKPATERELVQFATGLLPDSDIGAYTQGLMDLGATVCTPRRPACTVCPFASDCVARCTGRIEMLPTPKTKRAVPVSRASFVLARHGEMVWIERREERGIWGGLWSLPASNIDSKSDADGPALASLIAHELDQDVARAEPDEYARFEHTFSHFKLLGRVWSIDISDPVKEGRTGRWINLAECDALGLPAPIKTLLMLVKSDALQQQ